MVDGIPATLPDGQASLDHLDIGTLGRVEVLRGPSSALFGNAGGGVLSFTTRAPAARPFEVEVAGVGGSDALMRGQVTASGTVEGTGYLVSAYRSSADGFRVVPDTSRFATDYDSYGEFQRLGMNAKVTRAVAGGELSLTANVLDLEAENPGSRRFQDSEPWGTIANTYLIFLTRKDITQQQAGLRWTGALGGFQGDFSVYGAHRTVYNPIPNDLVDLSRNGGGVRAALSREYALGIGDFEWHAGVDLDLQSDDRKEFGNDGGEPSDPLLDQQEKVRGTGVFFQGNLELSNGIDALAGLRYDSHHFEAEDRLPFTEDNPDHSGSRTMSAFSPSVGLNIPLPGGLDVFGSVSTLFETPTTTELANQPDGPGGFNPDLDPMDGVSFEMGVRGDLGSVASVEVTAYQTNLQNELISFEIEGSGATFFRNAGESKHEGVEATISAADPSGLVRADVTGTWTDARFEEYVVGGTDRSGNRVPGVSPRRIQALLRLSPDLSFGEAYVEAIATLSDDVPVNDANTASAPDYTVMDLRIGLDRVAIGGLALSPWVAITNVQDEDYISSVAVNAFGTRFFEPGPPRSFQVGLRAAFGGGD
jgi:iron complex outermembrane receptor protein